MGLITIDQNKCKKDGVCVRECPFSLDQAFYGKRLSRNDSGTVKLSAPHADIVSPYCPHAALDHERVPLHLTSPIEENISVGEAQAVQFLRSRRSIRLFENRPVEEEKVKRLIDAAHYAPTAGNRQLVHWVVHTDRTRLKELAGLTAEWMRETLNTNPAVAKTSPYLPNIVSAWDSGRDSILWNAPVLIVASAPKQAAYGLTDVSIALTYLDLLAPAMGLGTCWAGLLQGALLASPSLREKAGIPGGHSHHYPMMLGHAALRHHRLPARKRQKSLSCETAADCRLRVTARCSSAQCP